MRAVGLLAPYRGRDAPELALRHVCVAVSYVTLGARWGADALAGPAAEALLKHVMLLQTMQLFEDGGPESVDPEEDVARRRINALGIVPLDVVALREGLPTWVARRLRDIILGKAVELGKASNRPPPTADYDAPFARSGRGPGKSNVLVPLTRDEALQRAREACTSEAGWVGGLRRDSGSRAVDHGRGAGYSISDRQCVAEVIEGHLRVTETLVPVKPATGELFATVAEAEAALVASHRTFVEGVVEKLYDDLRDDDVVLCLRDGKFAYTSARASSNTSRERRCGFQARVRYAPGKAATANGDATSATFWTAIEAAVFARRLLAWHGDAAMRKQARSRSADELATYVAINRRVRARLEASAASASSATEAPTTIDRHATIDGYDRRARSARVEEACREGTCEGAEEARRIRACEGDGDGDDGHGRLLRQLQEGALDRLGGGDGSVATTPCLNSVEARAFARQLQERGDPLFDQVSACFSALVRARWTYWQRPAGRFAKAGFCPYGTVAELHAQYLTGGGFRLDAHVVVHAIGSLFTKPAWLALAEEADDDGMTGGTRTCDPQ